MDCPIVCDCDIRCSAEIWKAFVKSREDPSFLEKRKRGQEAQSHNKHPHRLSQGGYALLHKQMMAEKLKERQDAAGGSQVPPPSPPQRHESWTRARQRPSGEYTSEETRVVAEKIDSLVSEGTFVPQGRHDILAEATGRVWLIYLHRHCIELGNNEIYGFIDPQFTHSQNERGRVQSYIQKKLTDDKKDCYLAPYLNNHHWQLLIINPKKLEVVFLCPLEKKPDKKITDIVEIALGAYAKLQGVRKQRKVEWLYLTSQKQQASYESGYYVMIHMLNIVSASIVDSWTQIFRDSNPFDKEEVKSAQERCAKMILEHIEANACG
ncbi:hypothetical protein P8452_70707 [Trifolium repens]|nr:hypothetical protein P8452_70707 [Trifolium repens]